MNLEKDYKISVLDYDGMFKLVYGKGGYPVDDTVFKRIRYFGPDDFNWNQRDSVKPYYVVLQYKEKVVGLVKIGYYSLSNPDNIKEYSISFFSIDINHRNKGFSRVMANKMFEFLKEKNYDLDTSAYTYVGKLKLNKIIIELSQAWGVKFTDNDGMHDHPSDYDENLLHLRHDYKEDV